MSAYVLYGDATQPFGRTINQRKFKSKVKPSFMYGGDKDIQFHRCKECGCVTHWAPTDKIHNRLAVNCRMLELVDLERLQVKKSDGPKRSS